MVIAAAPPAVRAPRAPYGRRPDDLAVDMRVRVEDRDDDLWLFNKKDLFGQRSGIAPFKAFFATVLALHQTGILVGRSPQISSLYVDQDPDETRPTQGPGTTWVSFRKVDVDRYNPAGVYPWPAPVPPRLTTEDTLRIVIAAMPHLTDAELDRLRAALPVPSRPRPPWPERRILERAGGIEQGTYRELLTCGHMPRIDTDPYLRHYAKRRRCWRCAQERDRHG